MNKEIFTWVNTHKEIVEFLKDKENSQKELIVLLKSIGIKLNRDKDLQGNVIELGEIDPFTFFRYFYKYGSVKRLNYLQQLATTINIKNIPMDTNGIPSARAEKLHLFPYKSERTNKEIMRLWNLFFNSLSGDLNDEIFEDVLKINSLGPVTLTEGLFNISPNEYFPINGPTKPYLKNKLDIDPKFKSYTEYKNILIKVNQKTRKPFYQISHEAWEWNENKKKEQSKNNIGTKETTKTDRIVPNHNKFNPPSNFILYGPPGTGKTYKTVDIAATIIGKNEWSLNSIEEIINVEKNEKIKEEDFHLKNTKIFNAGLNKNFNQFNVKGESIHFVTFHQNYSYEEFVGGLRPVPAGKGNLQFKWKPGIFIKACAKALELARSKDKVKWNEKIDKKENIEDWFLDECAQLKKDDFIFDDKTTPKVVLIIDEINRANISRVFGELITLIEDDKRIGGKHQLILTLPNGDKKFGVPKNLIIMGTMNTADKSLALLDVALRRRFEFKGLFPKNNLIDDEKVKTVFNDLNNQILKEKKSPNLLIGHSYFMGKGANEDNNEFLKKVFNTKVIPLLNEYFMNDAKKIQEKIFLNNEKDKTKEIIPSYIENGVLKYGKDEKVLESETKGTDGKSESS